LNEYTFEPTENLAIVT